MHNRDGKEAVEVDTTPNRNYVANLSMNSTYPTTHFITNNPCATATNNITNKLHPVANLPQPHTNCWLTLLKANHAEGI
jgi:hypothetical protein